MAAIFLPQATKKFFGAAVFQKCCRGVGEQPTFAKQIETAQYEMQQKSKRELEESQLPLKLKGCNERQGFRGNCDSQASWGCAPALPNRFRMVSLEAIFRTFHVKHSVATVPPEQLQDICFPFRFHKAGRSCSPRLEKRSLFSPPPPCAKRMARGFRCLRAAIRATRPEPRQHF